MYIEGKVKVGKKTKDLVKYLDKDDIAILFHDDIDELAALSIVDSGVKCVLNTGKCMTGRYESKGTHMLFTQGVAMYDIELPIDYFRDGDFIRIKNRDLHLNNNSTFYNACTLICDEYIRSCREKSMLNSSYELTAFINNSLYHAAQDARSILYSCKYPELSIRMEKKHVLVVARGASCNEDIKSLKDYISYYNPVLIGVDGGADALINCGYTPDILIGDMDSVSDIGIYRSRELILHAYSNGYCPCLSRIEQMNVRYKILPMPGTSEDVALLLAYDNGAEMIVLVGGHACMDDFLEKGRNGMGSTILTRIKVGGRLVDYKGISKILLTPKREELYYGKSVFDDENLQLKERDRLCLKM